MKKESNYSKGISYETFMRRALGYDRYDPRIGDWSFNQLEELQDNVIKGLRNILGLRLEYDQRKRVDQLIIEARRSSSKDELCVTLREGIQIIVNSK